MIKLLSLFSGIGAFEKALFNLGIPYKLIGYCEIDKYASKSYSLIHNVPESFNLGDITKVNEKELPDFDLITWGFPCQDISVAGKQKGIQEGTRSGLYYEGYRILKEKLPNYSIIENVKNLVGKKHRDSFEMILKDLEELGYNNYWKVLNAKDYGVPQNRERVFIVSIRKDVDTRFEFPKGFDNKIRLKDVLEDKVDEKYYLRDEQVNNILCSTYNCRKTMIQNPQRVWQTLCARDYKDPKCIAVPCLTPDRVNKRQNGRRFKEDGEPMFTLTEQDRHGVLTVDFKQNYVQWDYGNDYNSQQNRAYYPEKNMGTIPAGNSGDKTKVLLNYQIRKLTPKECWRLMGFDDTDIDKCIGISNTQLYKQAGNSIVVNVLEGILNNLIK